MRDVGAKPAGSPSKGKAKAAVLPDSDPEAACCSICLGSVDSDDAAELSAKCHVFHFDCISKWCKLNPSCPNCKVAITWARRVRDGEKVSFNKRRRAENAAEEPPDISLFLSESEAEFSDHSDDFSSEEDEWIDDDGDAEEQGGSAAAPVARRRSSRRTRAPARARASSSTSTSRARGTGQQTGRSSSSTRARSARRVAEAPPPPPLPPARSLHEFASSVGTRVLTSAARNSAPVFRFDGAPVNPRSGAWTNSFGGAPPTTSTLTAAGAAGAMSSWEVLGSDSEDEAEHATVEGRMWAAWERGATMLQQQQLQQQQRRRQQEKRRATQRLQNSGSSGSGGAAGGGSGGARSSAATAGLTRPSGLSRSMHRETSGSGSSVTGAASPAFKRPRLLGASRAVPTAAAASPPARPQREQLLDERSANKAHLSAVFSTSEAQRRQSTAVKTEQNDDEDATKLVARVRAAARADARAAILSRSPGAAKLVLREVQTALRRSGSNYSDESFGKRLLDCGLLSALEMWLQPPRLEDDVRGSAADGNSGGVNSEESIAGSSGLVAKGCTVVSPDVACAVLRLLLELPVEKEHLKACTIGRSMSSLRRTLTDPTTRQLCASVFQRWVDLLKNGSVAAGERSANHTSLNAAAGASGSIGSGGVNGGGGSGSARSRMKVEPSAARTLPYHAR